MQMSKFLIFFLSTIATDFLITFVKSNLQNNFETIPLVKK